MPRIKSPSLEFTVECNGGQRGLARGSEKKLIIIGRMIAGEAARTQGWTPQENQPVYVLMTANMPFNKSKGILGVGVPSVNFVTEMVARMLVGPVIKKTSQICASLVIKKECKDRRYIEVLVGAPKDWADLNHDIRNG